MWASRSLARSPGTVGLISSSCSSARVFAPRFFQTSPRDDDLALHKPFSSFKMGRGLSPPSYRTCSAHQKKAREFPPAPSSLQFLSDYRAVGGTNTAAGVKNSTSLASLFTFTFWNFPFAPPLPANVKRYWLFRWTEISSRYGFSETGANPPRK